jgi:hypothetical protein
MMYLLLYTLPELSLSGILNISKAPLVELSTPNFLIGVSDEGVNFTSPVLGS